MGSDFYLRERWLGHIFPVLGLVKCGVQTAGHLYSTCLLSAESELSFPSLLLAMLPLASLVGTMLKPGQKQK